MQVFSNALRNLVNQYQALVFKERRWGGELSLKLIWSNRDLQNQP